ncbi:MAG: Crp/Fnr family transcriptional regulator [Bacteroidales bacterium]
MEQDEYRIWQTLTEQDWKEMIRASNLVRFENRETIFRQDTRSSHFMFVEQGLVKIYKTGKSKKILTLKLEGPGHFVGLLSVLGSEIHQYSASAVGPASIRFFDHDTFLEVVMRNGNFSLNLLREISRHGLFMFDKLISQAQKQLPGKVAEVILYFSENIFHSQEFEIPLTREEMSQLAGTTKESFIRTLSEFRHDKIIDLDGKKISIRSMKIIRILNDLG